jgi:hypothetical protein
MKRNESEVKATEGGLLFLLKRVVCFGMCSTQRRMKEEAHWGVGMFGLRRSRVVVSLM